MEILLKSLEHHTCEEYLAGCFARFAKFLMQAAIALCFELKWSRLIMWATIKQCQTVVYCPLNLAQGFKMYFYSQGKGQTV